VNIAIVYDSRTGRTRAAAEEMAQRGPKAEVVTIPDCGHAPALMDPAQIAIIRDWLGAG